MPQDRIYEDLSLLVRRARTVFWIVAGLSFLALAFYWKLQILDHRKYEQMAEANRSRMRVLAAPRGLIRDRDGGILADNVASFKISLLRENVKDEAESFPLVSRLLGIDEATLRTRLDLHRDLPLWEPLVIADGLGPNDIAPVESRRLEFPELVVEAEPRRIYPGGTLAGHVLGYLQEPTVEEIRARPERKLRPGEMVGKSGIERQYDDVLKGQDGAIYEIVDSRGRVIEEGGRVYPIQGNDLKLTLDRRLQAEAERALEGREGVIIALEPGTGNVLALASSPTFDPNKFITRFTPQEWLALQSDPLSPLENRSIRGLYAPGSIFKLVMGLGGLGFGFVNQTQTVYCSGATEIYGAVRHCWFAPGHGAMDLADAIRNSCNIYFYALGRRMSIDQIALAAGRLGLGRETGLDLPGEKEGLVPSVGWKKKALNAAWYPGETISVAIGQGQLQVTPMQVAALTARIARRGPGVRPRLVEDGRPPAIVADPPPAPGEPAPFSPATYEAVIAGMWKSVNDGGTGQGARVDGFDVCGKTGSTQTMSRESAERLARAGRVIKTHSWFSGFAPRVGPKIVVTVLVEYGGGGGAMAAPVAGRIFDLYKQELEPK
ncbi:MAG TPA: penicillin-binding protein 2 [Candidatus Aminicenantes bacterium]|nr:penicillin-binding protein 2 [Candidatus Aminicenantes bacterium]HRY65525.1 penicillin-binding protein 2 [Candidatus Aminicenantes bacterium]HRZ72587.1 penicillin-binding protein 2 [Candidatus Aminicenantes bacterium]